jgi:hypothetical protein
LATRFFQNQAEPPLNFQLQPGHPHVQDSETTFKEESNEMDKTVFPWRTNRDQSAMYIDA